MGLSGAKRRTKISRDPNNTTWLRDTDGFGHKILSAQGWKPGQLLGAENANHAEHFTAANASHIRVALREDNLGLGAQLGAKSNAETFGLSTLSGIFGRLNGKSDEDLERQQKAQRDIELRTYQSQKYGYMNFVRGGILVGDKIEDLTSSQAVPTKAKSVAATAAQDVPKTKSSKRKLEADEDTTAAPFDINAKALLRAEKRERKEARRAQKLARQAVTTKQDKPSASSQDESSAASAVTSGSATPSFAGSRHNVRQRFIQQKRMASLDARALDEILMRKMPVC